MVCEKQLLSIRFNPVFYSDPRALSFPVRCSLFIVRCPLRSTSRPLFFFATILTLVRFVFCSMRSNFIHIDRWLNGDGIRGRYYFPQRQIHSNCKVITSFLVIHLILYLLHVTPRATYEWILLGEARWEERWQINQSGKAI